MQLNQQIVKMKAEELDAVLRKYAAINEDAANLQSALAPCIEDALSGRILKPLAFNAVPGGRMFDETNLRQFRDLETAYARFKIYVTGHSDDPILQRLREMRQQEERASGSAENK